MPSPYVDFDSLPKVEGQPHGNAWGLWGENDELGSESEAHFSVDLASREDSS